MGSDSEQTMTYIVNDNCIKCKFKDCVEVCPVDCFYEGENMLVINPDECIDCGVCVPECPADAIISDLNVETNAKDKFWLKMNTEYAEKWPNITSNGPELPDANSWNPNEKKGGTYKGGDKTQYFSGKPAKQE